MIEWFTAIGMAVCGDAVLHPRQFQNDSLRNFYVGDPVCTDERLNRTLRSYEPVITASNIATNIPDENRFYHGFQPIIISKTRHRQNETELRKTFAAKYRNEPICDITLTLPRKRPNTQAQIQQSEPVVESQSSTPSHNETEEKPAVPMKIELSTSNMPSSRSFDALDRPMWNGPIPVDAIVMRQRVSVPTEDDSSSLEISTSTVEIKMSSQNDKCTQSSIKISPPELESKSNEKSEITIKSENGKRRNVIRKNELCIYADEKEIQEIRAEMLKLFGLPKGASISNFVFQ